MGSLRSSGAGVRGGVLWGRTRPLVSSSPGPDSDLFVSAAGVQEDGVKVRWSASLAFCLAFPHSDSRSSFSIFCASARGRLPSLRAMEFQGAEGGPIGRGFQDQCDWGSNLE